jgi:hypothetical protein
VPKSHCLNIGSQIDWIVEQNAGFRQHFLDLVSGLRDGLGGGIDGQFDTSARASRPATFRGRRIQHPVDKWMAAPSMA